MLITFIRTSIITLDIDDHHIAVLGKPFVAFPLCRKFKTCFLKKAPNVRYSWGISGILNQNSVNSEFVKWRPRISRSPFFAFFMWDYFPLQGNITIFANITPKKFYLFVVLLFISSIDISFNSLTVCNSSVFEFRTTPGSKLSDNTFIS